MRADKTVVRKKSSTNNQKRRAKAAFQQKNTTSARLFSELLKKAKRRNMARVCIFNCFSLLFTIMSVLSSSCEEIRPLQYAILAWLSWNFARTGSLASVLSLGLALIVVYRSGTFQRMQHFLRQGVFIRAFVMTQRFFSDNAIAIAAFYIPLLIAAGMLVLLLIGAAGLVIFTFSVQGTWQLLRSMVVFSLFLGGFTCALSIAGGIFVLFMVATKIAKTEEEGLSFLRLIVVVSLLLFLTKIHSLAQQLQQQQRQQQAGNSQRRQGNGSSSPTTSSSRIHEIVDIVLQLPIEEFVPWEDMPHARVATLLQMLRRRQSAAKMNGNASFVEKADLVAAVKARRQYCKDCSICHDEYQTGDPLRVLPNCRHEFHVDCLDQWAFTFASNNNQQQRRQPTCPLCNVTLV